MTVRSNNSTSDGRQNTLPPDLSTEPGEDGVVVVGRPVPRPDSVGFFVGEEVIGVLVGSIVFRGTSVGRILIGTTIGAVVSTGFVVGDMLVGFILTGTEVGLLVSVAVGRLVGDVLAG